MLVYSHYVDFSK